MAVNGILDESKYWVNLIFAIFFGVIMLLMVLPGQYDVTTSATLVLLCFLILVYSQKTYASLFADAYELTQKNANRKNRIAEVFTSNRGLVFAMQVTACLLVLVAVFLKNTILTIIVTTALLVLWSGFVWASVRYMHAALENQRTQ